MRGQWNDGTTNNNGRSVTITTKTMMTMKLPYWCLIPWGTFFLTPWSFSSKSIFPQKWEKKGCKWAINRFPWLFFGGLFAKIMPHHPPFYHSTPKSLFFPSLILIQNGRVLHRPQLEGTLVYSEIKLQVFFLFNEFNSLLWKHFFNCSSESKMHFMVSF